MRGISQYVAWKRTLHTLSVFETQMIYTTGYDTTIYGHMTSTNYIIEVAAVNSAGVGVYSDPLIASKVCYA